MWPWEHLAIGYLAFSLIARVVYGRPPTRREALAVAVGTQFPDLVDKPLGWLLHVLPSGLSLGHSLLFGVPVVLAVGAVTRWNGRSSTGLGFGVGYLLHMPADIFYGVVLGGTVAWRFLLWPLVPQSTMARPENTFTYIASLFHQFTVALATPAGTVYFVLEIVLLSGCLVQWRRDGFPGLPWPTAPE